LYFAKCQALVKSAYHKAKVELQLSVRIPQPSSAPSEDMLVGRQEKAMPEALVTSAYLYEVNRSLLFESPSKYSPLSSRNKSSSVIFSLP
jgi:hypothetical protein